MKRATAPSQPAESSHLAPVLKTGESLRKVPLEHLPLGQPLPCPLYLLVAERYVMFRQRGDTISRERVLSLNHQGARWVFVPRFLFRYFLEAVEEMTLPESSRSDEWVRHMKAILSAYCQDIQEFGTPPKKGVLQRIRQLSDRLAGELFHRPADGIKHIHPNQDPSTYFVNHAINSTVYACLIGKSLGYPLDEVQSIALGCFLHDIGNIFIPSEVMDKEGNLTREELNLMRTHTARGAELLEQLGAPVAVVAMALQHHERVDGKGYPRGLKGVDIHPYAKIAAIADVYDAMTSDRAHQGKITAEEAMRRMRADEGLFDQEFLDRLSFDRLSEK